MSTATPAPNPPRPKVLPVFGSIGDLRANPMLFFTKIGRQYAGIARYFDGREPTFLGAGHRLCVGASLAQMQTTVMTAMICQRFQLDVMPGYSAETAPGTVMRPAGGMPMLIHRRCAAPAEPAASSETP